MNEESPSPSLSTANPSRRLHILNGNEIAALYNRPQFTPDERAVTFALTEAEVVVLNQLHTVGSRILFILQLGIFKFAHQFFRFSIDDALSDVEWIHSNYFPEHPLPTPLTVSKGTRLKHQTLILELTGYRSCGEDERQQLRDHAAHVVRTSSKPRSVFRELRTFLAEQKIVSPGYTVLQDRVSQAVTNEQNRLSESIKMALSTDDIKALKTLLDNPNGLYEITRIKREPKQFGEKEMRREVERGEQLATLYTLAQRVLPQLNISNESITYYASLVGYYTVYKLRRFEQMVTFLYLICFIFHRYRQMHDNLITCLLYQVHLYNNTTRDVAKERIYAYHTAQRDRLAQAGKLLKLFTSDTIPPETQFGDVQTAAFAIASKEEIAALVNILIEQGTIDETEWQWAYLDERHIEFKRRIRPIVRALTFESLADDMPLLKAIRFIQRAFADNRSLRQLSAKTFPLTFIPDHLRRYLYRKDEDGTKQWLPDRYEFMVYRHLRLALLAGDIFCHHSVRFRSLENDLLDDQQWQQKEQLVAQSQLTILQTPIDSLLTQLEKTVEQKIVTINQRITEGKNHHFKQKAGGRWSLPYSRATSPIDHIFFEQCPATDLQTILQFTHEQTGLLHQFEPIQSRFSRRLSTYTPLIAALIAWGTNMGIGRMGQRSDISFNTLSAISTAYIRLETLHAANTIVSNATAQLPIFRLYDIDKMVHSSADGQKFETRIHTLNARHSSKYFGLNKGIVSYTLVANHIPLHATIIGANEHESHYVLDLLLNNTTSVRPTTHSTDTHGTNHINFALLHIFGYQFAPRYKDIYDKVRTGLYGFKHPTQYDESLIIKPLRKIQTDLIISEWDNLIRIFLSLAMKTTSQSIIVGKLSSYARKNRTKRALWEFDNIIRSLYLLDYVDSLSLRRHVQRALNRGEAYHQLRRAVSFANFGALRFRTENDQQIWGECSRLITNCIIYYNALILSKLLEQMQAAGNDIQIERLARVSPVAWRHINFHGRYQFQTPTPLPDIDALVQQLHTHPITLIETVD